jgi:hypothetical protein
MMIRFTILFLFFTLSLSASLTLSDSKKVYDSFTISYYYDQSNLETIESIQNQKFSDGLSNQFALGYNDNTIWFKLVFDNQSKRDTFVLYLTEPLWSTFDLYVYKHDQWIVSENGLNTDLENRNIHDVNPAFLLSLPTKETTTLYIKGHSVSSLIGEFILYTSHEYFNPTRFTITDFYTMYSVFFLPILLLNIFLLISMKEKIYAYYIAYVSSFIYWIAVQSGYYLSLGLPPWSDALHAVGTLFVLFLTLFSMEYLELKKRLRHYVETLEAEYRHCKTNEE